MAKSTKKPNSFSKGMKSDLDPNVITSDSYKSAINARLVNNEDNSFTLKSAEGNSSLIDFNADIKTWYPDDFDSGTRGSDDRLVSVVVNGTGGQNPPVDGFATVTHNVKRYIKTFTAKFILTIDGGSPTTYTRTYTIPDWLLKLGGNDASDFSAEAGYDAANGALYNDYYYAYYGLYHLVYPETTSDFSPNVGTAQEISDAAIILSKINFLFNFSTGIQTWAYNENDSCNIAFSALERSKTFVPHFRSQLGDTPANNFDESVSLRLTMNDELFTHRFAVSSTTLDWSTTENDAGYRAYRIADAGEVGLNAEIPIAAKFVCSPFEYITAGQDTAGYYAYESYDDSDMSFTLLMQRRHDTTEVPSIEEANNGGAYNQYANTTTGWSGSSYTPQYAELSVNWTVSAPVTVSRTYEVIGLEEFSGYIAALLHNPSTGRDKIITYAINADGTASAADIKTVISEMDLGFNSKTIVRTEKSEENESYHRLYWTDGVNPLRSINLRDTTDYYSSLESADDLNVFSNKKLMAPTVWSVKPGGVIPCGSHAYCYRLISADGKQSRISNITNPINIAKTDKGTPCYLIEGGPPSEISNYSVDLIVNDIDNTYSSIQIINIKYTSEQGAIEANIISEGAITDNYFNYTHSGNETLVSISINDLLANKVSWDVCRSIAVKDNRLFASNLSNSLSDITTDFRVKSYKYKDSIWSTYSNPFDNPTLHEMEFYDDGFGNAQGIHTYSYLKGSDHSDKLIPGAESDNFTSGDEGIRVTFRTKRFDLTDVQYFRSSYAGHNSYKALTAYAKVPLYSQSIGNSGPDGHYNNYSNPIFAEKYKGYQRGEIYRFGILFYDKQGNPGFVNVIGDIRMPDNETLYTTLDDSGNVIEVGPDGQRTFKYCGSVSISDSTCDLDASSNQTTVNHDTNTAIKEGMHIHGKGVPLGTRVVTKTNDTSFVMSRNAGLTLTNETLYFTDPEQAVNGYALYPHFEVKLKQSTLDSIGGYSIVRVDRTDSDKRILANGILTQTMRFSNNDAANGVSLKNRNGVNPAPFASTHQQHNTNIDSTFTFDSPEVLLKNYEYSKQSGDKLKVNCRLDSVQNEFTDENIPLDFASNSTDQGFYNIRCSESGNFAAGRFNPNSNGDPMSYSSSIYAVYTLNDDAVFAYNNKVKGLNNTNSSWSDSYKNIGYGQRVGLGGIVSSTHMGYDSGTGASSRDFRNSSANKMIFHSLQNPEDDEPTYIAGASMNITDNYYECDDTYGAPWLGGATGLGGVDCCDTLFISIDKNASSVNDRKFQMTDFAIGTDENILQRVNHNPSNATYASLVLFMSKLYTSIVRDVSAAQYGGNDITNFNSNIFISTGHSNFNPTLNNTDDVFGGDTYIVPHAYRKFYRDSEAEESHWLMPSCGIVFPVETTVNTHLRTGEFFGTSDDFNYNLQDDLGYNTTYSTVNNTKTFVVKPYNFEQINNYSNMIAASNLKLNGESGDAYTNFDASEVHELNADRGPIYNLFNLRGDIFALQQNGVAKLSINPRVVVDNADAAEVTIATGTGRVIERSDYVDTQYGSQHYNNLAVTNTSAYWFDSDMSSFCKLVYGKGILVQDLGITTQNSNLTKALKDLTINDSPLDTTKGGICVYKSQMHNEVSLSISHPTYTNNLHLTYDELADVMVSKKYQTVVNSINHRGELYTVGYTNLDGSGTLSLNKIWRENSLGDADKYYNVSLTNCLDLTFVCNENVYSTKKFDKLILYCSGNQNTQKFTTFTFTDSDTNTTFTNTGTGYKMANGKHIIPVTSTDGTSKAEGQYLIINGVVPVGNYPVEVFGALIHNRVIR